MGPVVTFYQLPEEEPAFLAYLQKSGDIWARAVDDRVKSPRFKPAPVAEFLDRFADKIIAYHDVAMYLGHRPAVLQPVLTTYEETVGGKLEPVIQHGRIMPGVHKIVGGPKVKRPCIDYFASLLVRYDRGMYRKPDELAESNLHFYPGSFRGPVWVDKPADFRKWAKNVLEWMRRRTPAMVPVQDRTFPARATTGVASACRKGLKLF
jgi:hypothetical protein